MLRITLKTKLVLAIIAAGTAAALTYKATSPKTGQTPQQRCMTRIKDLATLMTENKEVAFVFNSLMAAIARLNPGATQDQIIQMTADAIIEQCISDERSKQEV